MDIPNYPPNSDASKRRAAEDKDIKRVTSGDPIRRKKPLGKRFSETFVAGSAKSASEFVVFDVLLPAVRDMVVETGSEFLNKLIFGNSRRRGGSTPPSTGPTGFVTYNRPPTYSMGSRQGGPDRVMSRRARAQHNFDEIVLQSRVEAEEVIDRLYEVISRYGSVTVADLYELVGIAGAHTDNKWGWTELRGAGVSRVKGGYLLDLPEPTPLD